MEHESSLASLGEEVKKVARRDFLLLAIEAIENQEYKKTLEDFVKSNYRDSEFLKKFKKEAGSIYIVENSKTPPLARAPAPPPPLESEKEKSKSQCNEFLDCMDYFQKGNGRPYLEGGALIGGFGGGLIGGGLCVSALGVGAILSAPIIMPVVVGVSVGVAVGAVGGLVVGAIANQVAHKSSTPSRG